MGRGLLLAVVALLALASCGTSTTKTVTKLAPTPAPTPATSTAAKPATATTTATSSAAAPATTSAAAPATTAAVYFEGALGARVQRPASLQLTVDGTLFVSRVQWTSWGGPTATGSGNAEYHGCSPNCAQAPLHIALVSIRLFGVRVCSGRDYYSGVKLILNSGELLDKQFLQRSWSPC